MIQDEALASYLPDWKEGERMPQRKYFLGAIGSLYPESLTNLISHAKTQIFKPDENSEMEQMILVTSDWMEQLNKEPFFSSKEQSLMLSFKKGSDDSPCETKGHSEKEKGTSKGSWNPRKATRVQEKAIAR